MFEPHDANMHLTRMYLSSAAAAGLKTVDAMALVERYSFLLQLISQDDLTACLHDISENEKYLKARPDELLYDLKKSNVLKQQSDDARIALLAPFDRNLETIIGKLPLDFFAKGTMSDPGWSLFIGRFFDSRSDRLIAHAAALSTLRERVGAEADEDVQEGIAAYFAQQASTFGWEAEESRNPAEGVPTIRCSTKIPEVVTPVDMTVYIVAAEAQLEACKNVASLDASRDVAILYLGDNSEPLDNLHVEGRSVIRLSVGLMLTVASSQSPQARFREEILRQANLELISPYHSQGATATGMFYGRTTELAVLKNRKGSFALYGPRRIGKTSLAHRVKYLAENETPIRELARYMDCALFRSSADGLLNVAYQFGFDWSAERTMVQFVHAATQFRDQSIPDGQLLIILDEIDVAMEDEEILSEFFWALRTLVNQGVARVIMCGYRRLQKASQDLDHPLHNMVHFMPIGSLDDTAASDLIRKPLTALGLEFEGGDSLIKQVLTRTSTHPGAIQFFCHEILRLLNKTRERLIKQEHVTTVEESKEFEDYILAAVKLLPERDRKLLRSHTTREASTLYQIRRNCADVLDDDEVDAAVESLLDYMILFEVSKKPQRVVYAQPVIPTLIRRNKSLV